MSEVEDLVKRLRHKAFEFRLAGNPGMWPIGDDHDAAADALESLQRDLAHMTDHWSKAVDAYQVVESLQQEVARLREALDEIAHPVKYMQIKAKAEGKQIDGHYAIMLARAPGYLQGIARKSLAAHPAQGEGEA